MSVGSKPHKQRPALEIEYDCIRYFLILHLSEISLLLAEDHLFSVHRHLDTICGPQTEGFIKPQTLLKTTTSQVGSGILLPQQENRA